MNKETKQVDAENTGGYGAEIHNGDEGSESEGAIEAVPTQEEYVPQKRPRFQKISDVEKDAIIKKIATMYASGASTTLIAQTLQLHKNTVKKYIKHPSFMKQYEEDYAKISAPAKDKARRELARLVPKALKVIEENLDDGNLEAAKMVFKAIGLEQEEEKTGDTNISVILPSLGDSSPIINIPKEDVSSE